MSGVRPAANKEGKVMDMIQLIYGSKGSGKTKRLLHMVNTEAKETAGTIVFIDDDSRYAQEIDNQVRFVDISEYGINSPDKLYGFLCGMYAQNYDIQTFYIDAFLKIVGQEPAELEGFFKKFIKLCEKNNINAVVCMSADVSAAPEYLKAYII